MLALLRLPPAPRRKDVPIPAHRPGENLPPEVLSPDFAVSAVLDALTQNKAPSRAGADSFPANAPAARVEAFAGFVTSHAHFLQLHPQETLPLAHNHGAGSPVSEAAELLVPKLTQPWIARGAAAAGTADEASVSAHSTGTHRRRPWRGPERRWQDRRFRRRRSDGAHLGRALGTVPACTAGPHCNDPRRRPLSRQPTCAIRRRGRRFACMGRWFGRVRPRPFWTRGQGLRHCPDAGRHAGSLRRSGPEYACVGPRPRRMRARAEGAPGAVRAVALTPDGRLAMSAAGKVQIWDMATGEILREPSQHMLSVGRLALSADGRLAVSSLHDYALHVWDVARGHLLYRLSGHANLVPALALTGDGRLAVSGGRDGSLRVWDLLSGACVLEQQTSPVFAVALSADGAPGSDGRLRSGGANLGFDQRRQLAIARRPEGCGLQLCLVVSRRSCPQRQPRRNAAVVGPWYGSLPGCSAW